MAHEYVNNGSDIYRESFRIIRSEADLDRFPADVEGVVVRMIHAAADPAIADDIAFTPGVVTAARKALRAGAPILCDSSMTATGIIRSRLPRDNETICYIKDPRLADIAKAKNMTKTCAAVDLWAEEGKLDGAIVAIGNAPTALYRVRRYPRWFCRCGRVQAGSRRFHAGTGLPHLAGTTRWLGHRSGCRQRHRLDRRTDEHPPLRGSRHVTRGRHPQRASPSQVPVDTTGTT